MKNLLLWSTFLSFLALHSGKVFAKSKKMPLATNSIQVGLETLSFQQDQQRIELQARTGILNLSLMGPFRVKVKAWQTEPLAHKIETTSTDMDITQTDTYEGGFGGLELYNNIKRLKFSFAVGFQRTAIHQRRLSESMSGMQKTQKRKLVDQGVAVMTSIEAHMKSLVFAFNAGASHREAADRADAFGGFTIGFAY